MNILFNNVFILLQEIFEIDHRHLKLTFFNEELSQECSWYVVMETDKGVQSLVAAIREPWENEFGIELELSTFC